MRVCSSAMASTYVLTLVLAGVVLTSAALPGVVLTGYDSIIILRQGCHKLCPRLPDMITSEIVPLGFFFDINFPVQLKPGLIIKNTGSHEVLILIFYPVKKVGTAAFAKAPLRPGGRVIAVQVLLFRKADAFYVGGHHRPAAPAPAHRAVATVKVAGDIFRFKRNGTAKTFSGSIHARHSLESVVMGQQKSGTYDGAFSMNLRDWQARWRSGVILPLGRHKKATRQRLSALVKALHGFRQAGIKSMSDGLYPFFGAAWLLLSSDCQAFKGERAVVVAEAKQVGKA